MSFWDAPASASERPGGVAEAVEVRPPASAVGRRRGSQTPLPLRSALSRLRSGFVQPTPAARRPGPPSAFRRSSICRASGRPARPASCPATFLELGVSGTDGLCVGLPRLHRGRLGGDGLWVRVQVKAGVAVSLSHWPGRSPVSYAETVEQCPLPTFQVVAERASSGTASNRRRHGLPAGGPAALFSQWRRPIPHS